MNWPIFFKLNEEHFTSHLQYKHAVTFANRKYDELSYPENQKKCDPILVTLSKMRPHYRQSSRENATSSSNASPLASYKEKPSPPPKVTLSKSLSSSLTREVYRRNRLKNTKRA